MYIILKWIDLDTFKTLFQLLSQMHMSCTRPLQINVVKLRELEALQNQEYGTHSIIPIEGFFFFYILA